MGVLAAPVAAGEASGCAARRMWRNACDTLVAPDADAAWRRVQEASPPDSLWHTLRNCVAYQVTASLLTDAGVWQNMLNKGMDDVIQPAAFKLAIVLRHTPSELIVNLLTELLDLHPQSQDLMSYILALLTDDEPLCSGGETSESSESDESAETGESGESAESGESGESGGSADSSADSSESGDDGDSDDVDVVDAEIEDIEETNEAEAAEPVVKHSAPLPPVADEEPAVAVAVADSSENPAPESPPLPPQPSTPAGPAPLRDLQLFGDCELAVLAASREEYDAHAKLVRAEYSKLTNDNYVELRIKVLNQFNQIPKLFHTPEFECFESAARENIEREICTLREHLLTGRRD